MFGFLVGLAEIAAIFVGADVAAGVVTDIVVAHASLSAQNDIETQEVEKSDDN